MQADESPAAVGNGAPGESEPTLDDPRLLQAVREYQGAVEVGRRPNRQEFLGRYADIAGPLAECLEALEFVHVVGSRLEPPAAATAEPPPTLTSSEAVLPLGDFRLVREIGRGGMGIVHEAEQLSLGRRIALKVLPFALTLDPRQLQRFKNEARAAAQLHHSNIVPIYSVGCERGVHFYAMQYIEGQSLAAVIEELRVLAGRRQEPGATATAPGTSAARHFAGESQPTGPYIPAPSAPARLVPRESTATQLVGTTIPANWDTAFYHTVAQIGVQTAEALEHAHQQGVTHRDVKPANLLLDAQGHLWVTDFGLAQFRGDAALTMTGDVVGTLRYMSPEQALAKRGLVDHRTDVYSLGMTLYELLTLEPGFAGRDREELLRQVAFEEPRPPRKWNRAIPADLETIVLKATAKRVEERYQTAQELADDLKRFLEQKPIHARRPTVLERAAKWSRRHRAVAASAAVMLVLAVIGSVTSTILIAREQANTRAAYESLAGEQTRTQAAFEAQARHFQQARRMLDFFTQVTEEELADKAGVQTVRRKLLEEALKYYQDFIEHCPDDPSTRAELDRSYMRVVNLLNEMGAPAEAMVVLEQARFFGHGSSHEGRGAAETASTPGPLDWLRSGGPLLLEQPAVQEALGLSAESVEQVAILAKGRRAVFRDSQNLSLEGWRARFAQLAAQERAVLEGLDPEQVRRLKQIAWQHASVGAFDDPEVAEALALTAWQKENIKALQDEARRTVRGSSHRPGGSRPEDWKKFEATWRAARAKVLMLLTANQRDTWRELMGEPFTGELRLPFPGSFGPRPGAWGMRRP